MKHTFFCIVLASFFVSPVVFAQQSESSISSLFSLESETHHQVLWASFSPSLSLVTDDNTHTYNDYQTYSLGYTINSPLRDSKLPLLIESGAYLNLLHFTRLTNHTGNLFSAKVPANLLLRIELSPDLIIYPFAGLYGKVNVYGKESYQTKTNDGNVTTSLNILDKEDYGNSAMKRFLIGYQTGVRIRYSRYFLSFEYESSFTNLTTNSKYHMTSYGVGLMF